jgi:hypothetical protein
MTPLTLMQHGRQLFRGMRKRRTEWSPREPLFSAPDGWKSFEAIGTAGETRYGHVLADLLGSRQVHAVSFSFTEDRAFYYATSAPPPEPEFGFTGHVGTFRTAPIVYTLSTSGKPYLLFCEDDTVWLDPRWFLGTTHQLSANPIAADLVQSCARVDDEILLVHGTVRAARVVRANPRTQPHTFETSWQRIVGASPRFAHLLNVGPLLDAFGKVEDDGPARFFT